MFLRGIYIIIFLFLNLGIIVGQEHQEASLFAKEKISVGLGSGAEFMGNGIKANYMFSDNIGFTSALSFDSSNLLHMIGLEYRFLKEGSQWFCPYLFTSFGRNLPVQVNQYDSPFIRKRTFASFNCGWGAKFNFVDKLPSYWSISLSRRFLNHAKINDFIRDVSFTGSNRKFDQYIFSIGYICVLKKRGRKPKALKS